MVREGGLEPPRAFTHQILNLANLTSQLATTSHNRQQFITLSGISTYPVFHNEAQRVTIRNNLTGTIPGLPIYLKSGHADLQSLAAWPISEKTG